VRFALDYYCKERHAMQAPFFKNFEKSFSSLDSHFHCNSLRTQRNALR